MRPLLLSLWLATAPYALTAEPLFPNSVASNDLDFIHADDPGACWRLSEIGSGRTEMYDPRTDALFVDNAIHFDATFPGQVIRINLHPAVGDPQQRAMEATASLSRLPVQMRRALRYVNIHDGDGGAWAEDLGRFFTLYEGLMARRLAEHDLDETVFHETAHVALDPLLTRDPDWQSHQRADNAFITFYAAERPNKEDIAESALFAWTMLHHPGRLPANVATAVQKIMPNRLEYLGNMLADYSPPTCN